MSEQLNPTMTLAQIREMRPCRDGWSKLLAGLGYGSAGHDPERVVSLGDIAATNDAADALWCVCCLDWSDIAVRRAVIAGALMPAVRRVSAHTDDPRVVQAIAALDRWCAGDDSVDLAAEAAAAAAWAAEAGAAVWAAARATAAAARAAVWAAAAWAAAAERALQRQDIIMAFPPVAISELRAEERG